MSREREPYFRIVAGILAVAAIPPLGIIFFDGNDSLAILKDWQSGVGAFWGALFGLGAILIGALFNAKLNRDRDADLRKEEAKILASALSGELRALKSRCEAHVAWLEEAAARLEERAARNASTRTSLTLWPDLYSPVFAANADRIGMLGKDLAYDVAWVYGNIIKLSQTKEGSEMRRASAVADGMKNAVPIVTGYIEHIDGAVEKLTAIIDENSG